LIVLILVYVPWSRFVSFIINEQDDDDDDEANTGVEMCDKSTSKIPDNTSIYFIYKVA